MDFSQIGLLEFAGILILLVLFIYILGVLKEKFLQKKTKQELKNIISNQK